MPTAFSSVTRVAIEEIIREHTSESKFGYFLTEEAFTDLVSKLLGLLETSRSLKTAGDRILKQGPGWNEAPAPTKPLRTKNT